MTRSTTATRFRCTEAVMTRLASREHRANMDYLAAASSLNEVRHRLIVVAEEMGYGAAPLANSLQWAAFVDFVRQQFDNKTRLTYRFMRPGVWTNAQLRASAVRAVLVAAERNLERCYRQEGLQYIAA